MSTKFLKIVLSTLLLLVLPTLVFADAPTEGRAGRAEVRFMQGMIDHHQMALDMANHCLTRASTDEVRDICAAVIAAQTPEIAQMRGWLAEWYGVSYTPMSMLNAGDHAEHNAAGASADEHAEHNAAGASAGDHSQHEQGSAAMPGMGMDMPMMGGMGGMNMQGMMMQMHSMMMMMHMQHMMMQMQGMMQGMGDMQGMGMDTMGGMGMMDQMGSMMQNMQDMMGNMQGMGMMGGMGQGGASQGEHSEHHPEGAAAQGDDSQHSGDAAQGEHAEHDAAGLVTDPSMTMGMLAGLDRAEGIDYDIAWLESMIDHHDDAIHMAERILVQSEHAELVELAQAIISAQTAENAQMEALIETLSS